MMLIKQNCTSYGVCFCVSYSLRFNHDFRVRCKPGGGIFPNIEFW